MGFSSLGRKSAGPSLGKKIGSKLVKGLKVAGLGLVAGAGLYAAYHSRDKLHQDNDSLTEKESKELQDELQEKAEKIHEEKMEEAAAKGNVAPTGGPNQVQFAGHGGVDVLDKVESVAEAVPDVLDSVRDVKDAEGKFGKAKAGVGVLKAGAAAVKGFGRKNKEQKLIEGELDEKREKKMIEKEKKKARKEITRQKCLKEFPDSKIKRKACEKTGF